jgi:hypothetical protein
MSVLNTLVRRIPESLLQEDLTHKLLKFWSHIACIYLFNSAPNEAEKVLQDSQNILLFQSPLKSLMKQLHFHHL